MVEPTAILGVAGVTAMAVMTAGVTVKTAVLEVTPLSDAVMLLLPSLTPVAVEPLKVAAAVLEFQTTEPDISPVPSV
ncbi:MAG: hypothetical protein A3H31_08895 [Gallionellales bacterium RIFCSPLOWO2_02_FULL_57_47]|nr:MAG: hypothetical protein A3H31_08895 [Gallionellales bacterium RIFCSPLOWO2_02_FULL_57_47]OGT13622.1 MAG: hypothetical protein A3J49_00180 [Gallionellales bacterium RIFCSPHIGHO2_02_FULL_57_16]